MVKAAFAAVVFVAATTTILAGWGIVGYPLAQSGSLAATSYTTNGPQASSATSYSTTSSTGTVTTLTTESTTTTTSVTTTTVPGQTATTTTTTTAPAGQVVTSTITMTATSTTTTITGTATTITAATTTTAAQGGFVTLGSAAAPGESLLREAQSASLVLAPVCWIVLGGMWVWRGRVRARYSEMGFGSDVFELFMKMKGGATRIKVLNTLTTPKDRLQLAEELGVDWKTVDRHVQILNKYGFVREQAAYGTVRLYEVTPVGKMLLNLFDDLERTDGPVSQQPRAPARSQAEKLSGT